MIEIIPAIMPKDFADLREKAELVVSAVPLVQLDIMDGKFVPARSWPYARPDENFDRIIAEDDGMPFWDQLDYEIDLMVENPTEVIGDFVKLGAKRLVVHVESVPHLGEFIDFFRKEYGSIYESSLAPELGIAINIETNLDLIMPYLDQVEFIQFMGIATIGKQGEPFDIRVLDKIMAVRKVNEEVIISVDGGVSFESAPYLAEVGVNRFVSGSTIFDSSNIIETIEELQSFGGETAKDPFSDDEEEEEDEDDGLGEDGEDIDDEEDMGDDEGGDGFGGESFE